MFRLARLRFLSAPAILLLISIAFCWKLVLTNQYTWLEGPDLANQVLPWFQFQAGEWHRGSFPLWDPNHWAGQPLMGQAQPGAAYPLNWLLFSLPLRHGWIRQVYLHWYFVVIHFMGALFCYLLCRDLGRRRSASILAGCVFAFGGFVASNDWPQMLNGAVWAPLVFLFLLRAVRGVRPVASACLSGAFLGMAWLSGHHQIPIFISLTAAATWIFYIARKRYIIRLAALFGVFLFLVSALQTLPAYEYAQHSYRWVGLEDPVTWGQKVPYFIHSQYSTTPETFLGVLFPGMHHHTDPYIGILAISLAFLAVVAWFDNQMVRLFGTIALGGMFFAVGGVTLFHGLLYAILPVVDKARSPSMALFIFNFGIAVLCAYGLDTLRDRRAPEWGRRIAIGLFSVWVLVFSVVLVCALIGKPLAESRPLMTAIFAVLGSGLIYGYLQGHIAGRTMALIACVLVAGELSLSFGFALPNKYEKDRNPYLQKMAQVADVIRYLHTRPSPMRVDVDDQVVVFNAGDFYGFEQMGGYLASLSSSLMRVEAHTERTQRLFGVHYFVGKQPKFPDQRLLFQGGNGINVYRTPGTFERAWAIHKTFKVQNQDEFRGFISDEKNDLHTTAAFLNRVPELESCDGTDLVQVTRHQANEVSILAEMKCRGLVVLADSSFPGWKATVDGKQVEMFEPYGALRGVVVEKGSHNINMVYRPWSVQLGAVLTVLGFAGAIFFLTRRVNVG